MAFGTKGWDCNSPREYFLRVCWNRMGEIVIFSLT